MTIGTAVPYLVAFPFLVRVVLSLVPVPLGALARGSFLPAYALGAALAAALGLARGLLALDTVPGVLAVAVGGLAAYWVLYYSTVLQPAERRLVREVVGGFLPRRRTSA